MGGAELDAWENVPEQEHPVRSSLAGRSPVETNATPATEGGQILPDRRPPDRI
jgi:hypothetical protein